MCQKILIHINYNKTMSKEYERKFACMVLCNVNKRGKKRLELPTVIKVLLAVFHTILFNRPVSAWSFKCVSYFHSVCMLADCKISILQNLKKKKDYNVTIWSYLYKKKTVLGINLLSCKYFPFILFVVFFVFLHFFVCAYSWRFCSCLWSFYCLCFFVFFYLLQFLF